LRLQEKVRLRRAGQPVPRDERPETHERTILPAVGRYAERSQLGTDPISQAQLISAEQLLVRSREIAQAMQTEQGPAPSEPQPAAKESP
jgi:hypothetical protein